MLRIYNKEFYRYKSLIANYWYILYFLLLVFVDKKNCIKTLFISIIEPDFNTYWGCVFNLRIFGNRLLFVICKSHKGTVQTLPSKEKINKIVKLEKISFRLIYLSVIKYYSGCGDCSRYSKTYLEKVRLVKLQLPSLLFHVKCAFILLWILTDIQCYQLCINLI